MTTKKKFYLLSRKLKEEAQFNAEGNRDGITKTYYRNGSVKKELMYKNGIKEGPARRFYKDGTRLEFESRDGREKTGRWRTYNPHGLLIMEKIYSRTNDLFCELYYEYTEYDRTVTIQLTQFMDDTIDKYRQRADEYDKNGDPGFPVSERDDYPPVENLSRF